MCRVQQNLPHRRVIRAPAVNIWSSGLALCLALSAPNTALATDWPGIERALAQNAWPEAAPLIEQGLTQHPKDARLRLLLGAAQAKLGRLSQAQHTLSQLSLDHPELSEAHNNLGIVLAMQGETAAALLAFERAVLADPRNAAAAQNLKRAQAKQQGVKPSASK